MHFHYTIPKARMYAPHWESRAGGTGVRSHAGVYGGGVIMKCPYCGATESRVVDSRPTEDDSSIRRRRECERCARRFTTYEKVELVPLMVIKQDGRREPFDAEKLRHGLVKACGKRPVALHDIDDIVSSVERECTSALAQEISSKEIGEMVMRRLKDVDEISYVRFASVYRKFRDVQSFIEELNGLLGQTDNVETEQK